MFLMSAQHDRKQPSCFDLDVRSFVYCRSHVFRTILCLPHEGKGVGSNEDGLDTAIKRDAKDEDDSNAALERIGDLRPIAENVPTRKSAKAESRR